MCVYNRSRLRFNPSGYVRLIVERLFVEDTYTHIPFETRSRLCRPSSCKASTIAWFSPVDSPAMLPMVGLFDQRRSFWYISTYLLDVISGN